MISEAIKNKLLSATDRQNFVEIADFHGLKTRESLQAPVVFAYEQGGYKDRLTSTNFCNRCGTASNIVAESIIENVCYCNSCDDKRTLLVSDMSLAETANRFGVLNDPFLNSDRDVPHHVLRGEQFDDKLAMFRNEY